MLNCDGACKAQFVKDFDAKTCYHIEKKVEQYANWANDGKTQKVFEEGDLIWVHLRKKRFPNIRKSKQLRRGDVIKKMNYNSYILDIPQSYEGSHTFHVIDLSSFWGTQESNLRESSFQEGEVD
ncbi:hypothetical protein CR513_08062, partial [Mucuna pruriens]